MTRPRDPKTGRFVKSPTWGELLAEELKQEFKLAQPIDHGPRIELRTLVLAALFLVVIGAVFMGLAGLSAGGMGL